MKRFRSNQRLNLPKRRWGIIASILTIAIAGHFSLGSLLWGQVTPSVPATAPIPAGLPPLAPVPLVSEEEAKLIAERASEAERIAELRSIIEEEARLLKQIQVEFESPESEYAQAEQAFRDLNEEWERLNEAIAKAQQAGQLADAESLRQESVSIEAQRRLAQERFDLAIEERKTLREEFSTLRAKYQKDLEALAEITGDHSIELDPSDGMSERKDQGDGEHDSHHSHAGDASRDGDNRSDASDDRSASHRDDESRRGESEGNRNEEDSDKESSEKSNDDSSDRSESDEASDDESMEEDVELKEAVDEAEEKEAEAEDAEEESESLAARMADQQELIAQCQQGLAIARKKVALEINSQQTLRAELERLELSGGEETGELIAEIDASAERQKEAQRQVAEVMERLNDLRLEYSSMQQEHIVALQEAEISRAAAAEAQEHVDSLRNPFAPRNLLAWLSEHGGSLLWIIVGMFLLNRVASFFAHRSIRLVTSGSGRGSKLERENRAKTLVGVFQNAATVTICVSGILMILEEVGIDIKLLMGGVAVVGLAVAFGAQNLIKDYFYGFVMLLENQYMLNDTVRIGEVSGQVERITLRMTVLRDANGVVHFIPNGTINSVSNETHGWSRAVVEVAVGYQEDLNRVIEPLREVARDLRTDPAFEDDILEDATEPAVEAMGTSHVTLKFSVKTVPSRQGAVRNALLLRIKHKFDQLGIDPPYPQQVVHHASEDPPRLRHSA